MFNELKPKSKAEVDKELEMDMNIKLCDMGNACYVEQHYSDVIQTREYRSPEVILEGDYDESADIWSLACLVFELVTGDYLFDPKKGKTFKKNDDHLALVSELIGEPQGDELLWLKENCEAWGDFFEPANRNGTKFKLKRIKSLKMWPIYRVLQ
jgi:serine/threonine protein kinase